MTRRSQHVVANGFSLFGSIWVGRQIRGQRFFVSAFKRGYHAIVQFSDRKIHIVDCLFLDLGWRGKFGWVGQYSSWSTPDLLRELKSGICRSQDQPPRLGGGHQSATTKQWQFYSCRDACPKPRRPGLTAKLPAGSFGLSRGWVCRVRLAKAKNRLKDQLVCRSELTRSVW